MVHAPTSSDDLALDHSDHPAQPPARLSTHVIHQVVVVEVAGLLRDVVEQLDQAIQLALAEGPRGVVCDLSAVLDCCPEHGGAAAVELLATAGRHVRDWPAIPVAVVCPDQRVRDAVHAHALGGYLIAAESVSCALSAVLATATLEVRGMRLAPHPTAARVSRDFVTRTLLDWRLGRVIPFASLVVGELVASSTVHTATDLDVSVAWDRGALRLTVRDRGPVSTRHQSSARGLRGRGRTVVAGLSRAFGVLPSADGGQVVWAVLEAPRPRPSTPRIRTERAIPSQELPVFTDGRGLGATPFCAGSSRQPA